MFNRGQVGINSVPHNFGDGWGGGLYDFLPPLSSKRWRCQSAKKTWRTFLLQNQCFGHRKAATAMAESAECQQSEWKCHEFTGKMPDITVLAAFWWNFAISAVKDSSVENGQGWFDWGCKVGKLPHLWKDPQFKTQKAGTLC